MTKLPADAKITLANSPWQVEVELQIQFYDLDPMEVVWHGRYIEYFEAARCALLDQIDYNYAAMKESGYMWPIIDLQVRYSNPAVFRQRIKVRAAITEWENRLKMEYLVTDAASGQRLTRGVSTQVAVQMDKREMCFVSPRVLWQKLDLPYPEPT
ncbi:putative thioesterase [Herbaspirillum sp. CF444]|uniref:acyl-CoA thioesterase n=1 Tax=Herbaspirillum sp. CF444 TaxID=1144319 RepID=UPI000272401B|nr:acyl-CoA thioesterase [Herbaspirillum sp. CF444]EJL88289.1 putative thioesterase [Herbaspirillum sp. CF444]